MRKVILSILICLSAVSFSNAQTYIKANAPYWMVGISNVAIETKLWNNFTFNNDIVVSPWKSVSGNKMMFGQFIPELRYYPKESFKGFYAGLYGSTHVFKMSKWNYLNSGKYQKGWGFGAGLNIGYEVALSDRWLLDTYVSGGWQVSRYKGFYNKDGSQYVGLNNSGEWLPYRIGIAFAYRLGTGK